MDNLDLEFIMKSKISNFDQNFSTSTKVVLYGCGAQAQELLENCNKIEQIIGVSDKNKMEKDFMGYPFLTMEELKESKEAYKIAITSFKYYDEIKNELLTIFDEDRILPYANWQTRIHYNFDRTQYQKWLATNSKELEEIYNILADENSRKAFFHILLGLENVTASEFMDNTLISQFGIVNYFDNEIIKLSAHEKFVDVGAYDGDTIVEFIRAVNGKFDKIWAYEPDEDLFCKLKNTVSELKHNRIICKRAVIGKEKGEISFSINSNKFLSGPSEYGEEKIKMVTIDDLGEEVTFIKICIRGLKNIVDALEGASIVCRHNKPKLAVVAALTDEGVIEIPKKIYQLNPDYKIYFRLTVYPQANGQRINACFFAK